MVMHKEIVEAYTPLAACLITYGLNVLVGTLLGLVVFLGNMLGSRIYGSAVAIGWIVFSNMIDVVRLPKLRVLSPLHWTTTYAYLRSDDAVPLWYILAVEIAIILVTGFIIMKNRRHTHLTLLSQAYRTFAEGREDLENGKFDRNTGCRKKVRGTDGSGPCEPFCHTRKNIWNHRKERKRQDSSFKSICGFVLPDAGKILVRGKQVGKDVDIPQGIGIIIEHPGFLRDYSGFQNLKLLARLQKKSQMRR